MPTGIHGPRPQDSYRAVHGGESLVELGHSAPQRRRLFHQSHADAGVGQVKGSLYSGNTPTDDQGSLVCRRLRNFMWFCGPSAHAVLPPNSFDRTNRCVLPSTMSGYVPQVQRTWATRLLPIACCRLGLISPRPPRWAWLFWPCRTPGRNTRSRRRRPRSSTARSRRAPRPSPLRASVRG